MKKKENKTPTTAFILNPSSLPLFPLPPLLIQLQPFDSIRFLSSPTYGCFSDQIAAFLILASEVTCLGKVRPIIILQEVLYPRNGLCFFAWYAFALECSSPTGLKLRFLLPFSVSG